MQHFEPVDPAFREKTTASFHRQGFMQHLGAELSELEPGRCEIQIPFQESLTQQHGFFHAGVQATAADNAAGYAAFTLMAASSSILSVEFKINLLSPASGEMLIARAEVVKHGRTLTVCRSEVYVVNEVAEKHCATAQVTLMELPDRKDEA